MTAAIEVLVFAGVAGFTIILIATILVIIGVRQEQRVLEREGRRTFSHREPPTILALLARRVLGAHFDVIPGDTHRPYDPRPTYPQPRYSDPDPDPGPDYVDLDFGELDYLDQDVPDSPDEGAPPDDRPTWPKAG